MYIRGHHVVLDGAVWQVLHEGGLQIFHKLLPVGEEGTRAVLLPKVACPKEEIQTACCNSRFADLQEENGFEGYSRVPQDVVEGMWLRSQPGRLRNNPGPQ